jgi:hypothetical protein
MPDPLDPIRTALAALTKAELQGLQAAVAGSPRMAPALLWCLQHVCGWELRRRKRQPTTLKPPRSLVPVGDLGAAYAAVAALLIVFDDKPRARALLEALGDSLEAEPTTLQ